MVLSTGVPSLADKRYFLSQMSSDASWKGMASTSLCSSLTTLFMDGYLSPEVLRTALRPQNVRTGERIKGRPNTCGSRRSARLCVCDRCQTTAISAPRLPNPPRWHRDVATQHLVLGSEA